jgi:diguanylate cyclase
MPDYFKNHPIYYAGPAKTPEGYASGSFGPTTAGRMDSYVDQFQSFGGSMVMLAKGNRSRQVREACARHGGFYLGSIGGPAARLAQDCIKKVEVVEYTPSSAWKRSGDRGRGLPRLHRHRRQGQRLLQGTQPGLTAYYAWGRKMSAGAASKVQNMDTATMVLATMRRRGISGLPRNYELVYEALNASNQSLTREFESLSRFPGQDELDLLGKKHFPHHHRQTVVEGAHDKMTDEVTAMLRLLKQEQSSLESYSKLLGETSKRISAKTASSSEFLTSVLGVLSNATGDTMEKGKVVVEHMVERAREMEQVKLELDEYKRIANTDPLTRLANRRAFDETLSNLYNDKRAAMYHALIVADVDHFKKFNDAYGHPVGDRVLGIVAAVMKSSLRKDVFLARTGGEEFAVILNGTSLDVTMEIAERHPPHGGSDAAQESEDRHWTMARSRCRWEYAWPVMPNSAEELYNKADVALYAAKNTGRNCFQVYKPELNKEFEKNWNLYTK